MNKGRQKPSILSDALEALIGAVYLDGGFEAARALVHLLLAKQEQLLEQTRPGRDAKTELQEYLQRSGSANLRYQVERVVGPPHAATFYISAVLNGTKISQGSGHSKKIAEQNAAQAALQKIYEENK